METANKPPPKKGVEMPEEKQQVQDDVEGHKKAREDMSGDDVEGHKKAR